MAQVIIYTNDNGGVSVCTPTGELPIEEVLTKDCPAGAIIVDDSILPTEYFNAWELVNGTVVVNETKKQAIIDAKQTVIDTKASALAKLTALGLTQDEIKALVG
jgi:predicted HAD superfamily phosphohydrolase